MSGIYTAYKAITTYLDRYRHDCTERGKRHYYSTHIRLTGELLEDLCYVNGEALMRPFANFAEHHAHGNVHVYARNIWFDKDEYILHVEVWFRCN